METSVTKTKTARLVSPQLSSKAAHCVTFFYFNTAMDRSVLKVYVGTSTSSTAPLKLGTAIFSTPGDTSKQWLQARLPLPSSIPNFYVNIGRHVTPPLTTNGILLGW